MNHPYQKRQRSDDTELRLIEKEKQVSQLELALSQLEQRFFKTQKNKEFLLLKVQQCKSESELKAKEQQKMIDSMKKQEIVYKAKIREYEDICFDKGYEEKETKRKHQIELNQKDLNIKQLLLEKERLVQKPIPQIQYQEEESHVTAVTNRFSNEEFEIIQMNSNRMQHEIRTLEEQILILKQKLNSQNLLLENQEILKEKSSSLRNQIANLNQKLAEQEEKRLVYESLIDEQIQLEGYLGDIGVKSMNSFELSRLLKEKMEQELYLTNKKLELESEIKREMSKSESLQQKVRFLGFFKLHHLGHKV
jgi:multidrug efflux pump subunit AcrA (membrane-fusion protein)